MDNKNLSNATLHSETLNNESVASVLKNVYLWMCSALVVSGLTSMVVASSPQLVELIFSSKYSLWAVLLAQVGLVMLITSLIDSISFFVATLLFILYSVLTGAVLSSIFMLYVTDSLMSVFFIAAGTFAVISIFGYITKRDLSSWGSIFIMALFGLIIASIANFFMESELLYWIISYAGVLIFVGLTAYDTQKIKQMAYKYSNEEGETLNKVALLGALTLYLDFVNIFIYLLRIFGRRK
uniref:Bax inhibitor-1/YccA family protein n=1 Tax=Alistipes sp. TaxID=1872444 RepID=UPI004057A042